MKRRAISIAIVVMATAAMLTACKNNDPIEIDRTFDYTEYSSTTEEVQTQPSVQETTAEVPTTQKATEAETTTEPSAPETETETEIKTTAMSAETYFTDKKSVFSTLPLFTQGEFVEYFEKDYLQGVRFIKTTQKEFEEYVAKVKADGIYTVNSKDGNRVYLESAKNMCVTIIYYEGVTLIEAGTGVWDIITYAQTPTKEEATKPSETQDVRYSYFDDKKSVFSLLPYFTEGTFLSCDGDSTSGKMKFSGVSSSVAIDYCAKLESSGFDFEYSAPAGNLSIFGSDLAYVRISIEDDVMTIEAGKK